MHFSSPIFFLKKYFFFSCSCFFLYCQCHHHLYLDADHLKHFCYCIYIKDLIGKWVNHSVEDFFRWYISINLFQRIPNRTAEFWSVLTFKKKYTEPTPFPIFYNFFQSAIFWDSFVNLASFFPLSITQISFFDFFYILPVITFN